MARAEIAGRVRKKWLQAVDARRSRDWTSVLLKPGDVYPNLPNAKDAPESLRHALRRDIEDIPAGKWRAFAHLPIRVTDPPEWHKDYLAGVDLPTSESAFNLNYRELPRGADIKLIWELSRWHPLTRLALAAYILNDDRAAWKCVHWLEHWAQHNPPYRGWNWTSALESGLRLIQFTWIEPLLRPFVARGECEAELEQLRYEILPAHVWFTWRHKSFGSSANNHLIGELAGLILATVRWPQLSAWGAPIDELQELWEREVLAQFAADGGNREQALHYHLFSFELSWHAGGALRAAGRTIASGVEERLALAAKFFAEVQAPGDHWDYGDSDDAFVLPLAANPEQTTCEWLEWAQGKPGSLGCFIDEPPKVPARAENLQGWRIFTDSGIAVRRTGEFFLRWDISSLGYLSTAAHGHLDALHLSLWMGEVAMVIDPGTGAYYSDPSLRAWLASRQAHNGPCAVGAGWPHRAGPFLWAEHHPKPAIEVEKGKIVAELAIQNGLLRRSITVSELSELVVEDSTKDILDFTVLWQFAPKSKCRLLEPRRIRVGRRDASMDIQVSEDWEIVDLVAEERAAQVETRDGVVSSHFRSSGWAPYLKLTAKTGHKPCVFRTTFLASPAP
jgi:hypothetical protein